MKQVIYVPGLGDDRSYGQLTALRLWRVYGLRVHYYPLRWADGEAFGPKLRRLLRLIDKLAKTGGKVALVGTSAGASAIINAYIERQSKISSLVYICGKVQNPQTVSKLTYKRNPAFKDSIELLQRNLPALTPEDKRKILSVRPVRDSTVPVADTKIPDVREKVMPMAGHMVSIVYALTLGSHAIAKFIKKSARV